MWGKWELEHMGQGIVALSDRDFKGSGQVGSELWHLAHGPLCPRPRSLLQLTTCMPFLIHAHIHSFMIIDLHGPCGVSTCVGL